MLKNKHLYFLVFLLYLASCDDNRVYDEYKNVPGGSWKNQHNVSFDFTVKDTTAKRNLFINLRNNNAYPFSNLFVITTLTFPDQQKIIDTLEYDMTDKTGKFLGKGFSEIKENKLFYKENITFPTAGNYNFSISQAMRKNGEVEGVKSLDGITEVGFRIEKN